MQKVVLVTVWLILLMTAFQSVSGPPTSRLGAGNFQVFAAGASRPLARPATRTLPYQLILIVDTSLSVEQKLDLIGQSTHLFFRSLGREDQISVIHFKHQAEVLVDFTNEDWRLEWALARLGRTNLSAGSAVYDALALALERQTAVRAPRKAIVLLTDGVDNCSKKRFKEVKARLAQSRTACYIIELDTEAQSLQSYGINPQARAKMAKQYRRARRELRELAACSGGAVFTSQSIEALAHKYSQVIRELGEHNFIGY